MKGLKPKQFMPTDINPLPWHYIERDLWHTIRAANGKTVCSCRNIKDAIFIVETANKTLDEQLADTNVGLSKEL